MNCFIVSNNICEVSIETEEEMDISIRSIQGNLVTPVLKKNVDYVTIIDTNGKKRNYPPPMDYYTQLTEDSILSIFEDLLEKDKSTNLVKYKCDILYATPRFKYVLGISKCPVKKGDYTQTVLFGNGPSFMCVTCDQLTGSGCIMPNVYALNGLFQLQGPGFTGNDLRNIVFRIKGLYGEDIEINDDLLWSFELSKHSDDKNDQLRFSNQYAQT